MKNICDIMNVKLTLQKYSTTWKEGMRLKNKIEEIRTKKGIKQDELGKLLGVSRQTISSLENGRYNPSILLAFKIANLFEMPIEEIFIYEEEES